MTTHVADETRIDEPPRIQTTVFETDAQLKKHLDRTPASIKQLIVRFGIGAVAALTLVSVFTAYASRRVGTDQAIADARIATEYIAKGVIETNLTDAMINGDKVALSRFNNKIQSAVIDESLVRVKIWNSDGKIVYSNEENLVGQTFPLDD